MAASLPRSDIQKKGFLYKLPVSGGVIKVWAKRWVVFKSTSHEGVIRLEYYDKEEHEIKGDNKRVIILRGCTGCCETSEYKRTRPFAFQFSTSLGHHVFSTDSQEELDEWIDTINQYLQEDRRKQRKKNKSKMVEETRSFTTSDRSGSSIASGGGGGGRDSAVPHPSTLMGVYQVIIEDNEYSKNLGISGIHSLCVTPRGLRLVSRNDEKTVAAWHFRHIRSYAKSASKQVVLDIGNSRRTGPGGKLLLTTGSSKEMFSMIHRNIKFLKAAQDRQKEEKVKATSGPRPQVPVVEVTTEIGGQNEGGDVHSKRRLRPRSKVYELQQQQTTLRNESGTATRRFPSFIEQDDDLIHLEGFGNEAGMEDELDDDLQQFLDSLDPIMQQPNTSHRFDSAPVLENVDTLSSEVYGTARSSSSHIDTIDHSLPPPLPPPRVSTTSNPFLNVDPFSGSLQTGGSFYNSKEDIFEDFHSSPQKTSTPSNNQHLSTNPFTAHSAGGRNHHHEIPSNPFATSNNSGPSGNQVGDVAMQGLHLSDDSPPPLPPPRPDYIYARPVKPKNRMSTQEFDQVWEDIVSDVTWSND